MKLIDAVIDEINNIRGFKTTSGELILEEKAELITKIVSRLLHEATADTDTVSRKAAMDAVCEELDSIDHVPQWVFDRLTKKIENLPPSPTQSRQQGYWKGKPIAGFTTVRCSCCGMAFCENDGLWKYCPECGADMRWGAI